MGSAVTITPDAPAAAPVTITPDDNAKPRTWLDSATDFAKGIWQKVNPVSGVQGAAQATAHPINTYVSDASNRQELLNKAEDAFKKGNYSEGVAHALYGIIPFLGPQMDQAGTNIQQGNIATGLGQSVGMGLSASTPALLRGANSAVQAAIPAGAAESAASRLYQSALKPSTALPAAKVASAVQTGIENSIPVSTGGLEKIGDLMDDLNQKIADQIKSGGSKPWPAPANVKGLLPAPKQVIDIPASVVEDNPVTQDAGRNVQRNPNTGRMQRIYTSSPATPPEGNANPYQGTMLRDPNFGTASPMAPGTTINPQQVASRLNGLKSNFATQVNPNADLAAIDKAKQEFLENNPGPIPADQAQALKQGTYKQLNQRAYGELGTATVESQKALARGLKEEIANAFPGIADLNAADSKLIGLNDVMERAVKRISNHQMFGIGTPLAAAGAKAVTGSTGVAGVAGMLKALVDDPYVKSKLAIALSKASKGQLSVNNAAAQIGAYSSALGNAATPAAPGDQDSQ